jgi:hypothetical protein
VRFLHARRPLAHPARQITFFLGLRRLWVYAPISLASGIGLLGLLGNPNNTRLSRARLYAAYSLASTNHPPPEGGARTGPGDPSAEITEKYFGCAVAWAYRFVLAGHARGRRAAATCSSTLPPLDSTTPAQPPTVLSPPPGYLELLLWGQTMASAPPRPAAQSIDKKDMSRTNYNGGITTTLATKLCTYIFQLPLQQTPRLQYQISVGAPLH